MKIKDIIRDMRKAEGDTTLNNFAQAIEGAAEAQRSRLDSASEYLSGLQDVLKGLSRMAEHGTYNDSAAVLMNAVGSIADAVENELMCEDGIINFDEEGGGK